jgi:hypothetical protein
MNSQPLRCGIEEKLTLAPLVVVVGSVPAECFTKAKRWIFQRLQTQRCNRMFKKTRLLQIRRGCRFVEQPMLLDRVDTYSTVRSINNGSNATIYRVRSICQEQTCTFREKGIDCVIRTLL